MSFKYVEDVINDNKSFIYIIIAAIAFLYFFNAFQSQNRLINSMGSMVQDIKLMASLEQQDARTKEQYTLLSLKKDLVENARLESIYQGVILKGASINSPKALEFFRRLNDELLEDSLDLKIHAGLSEDLGVPLATFIQEELVVRFFDNWYLPVEDESSPWVKKFPASPSLLFNNELIKWPECGEANRPSLAVRVVSEEGVDLGQVNVTVIELDKIRSWQVNIDGLDALDPSSFVTRILAVKSCVAVEG